MSVNRYKRAVCLSYDSEMEGAPEISVNGMAFLADEVVKIARRYGVPVVEDPALANSLGHLDEQEEISEDLYEAVAILLARVQELSEV